MDVVPPEEPLAPANPYAAPRSRLGEPDGPLDITDLVAAEPGPRVLAWLIDGFIFQSAVLLVVFVVSSVRGAGFMASLDTWQVGLGSVLCRWLWGGAWDSSAIQGTPGKRLMGLGVVDLEGARLTPGRALMRNFGKYLLLSLCWIAGISALTSDPGRSLWDGFADTKVVRR